MTDRQAQFQPACDLEIIHDRPAKADAFAQLQDVDGVPNAESEFQVGHTQFHLGDLEAAARHISEAIQLNPNNARWHFRLGYIREKQQMLSLAVEQYQAALQLEPGHARWQHRLDSVLEATQRQREAELAEQTEARSSFKQRLARLQEDKAPKWQELDALSTGRPLFKDDPDWLSRLGDALFLMNRFPEAAQELEAASRLRPEDAELHFKAGWAHHLAGAGYLATTCFKRAIATDKLLQSARLGIGAFFQKKGHWRLAADHYAQDFQRNPNDAELAYRWGFALQRCYDWKAGARAIRTAIALDHVEPRWHYRLGFSLERLSQWEEAAEAYSFALQLSPKRNDYWAYRLGYVLTKARRFEDACLAFSSQPGASTETGLANSSADPLPNHYLASLLNTGVDIARSTQTAEACSDLARRAEENGLTRIAAQAYAAAVQRSEKHAPDLYSALGVNLASLGQFEEATAAYLETRLLKRPHGVDTSNYLKDKTLRQSITYVEYLETLDIRSDVIMYESNHGGSVSCNPLNIFRSIRIDERFSNFTHVWVLDDRTRIPEELRGLTNVIYAARDSDLYLRYLSSAKYLINNNTFPPYFSRRPEQKYLNTWHGTPMKTLGREIKGGFMEHRNATRNFLHATHLLAPNDFTAKSLIEDYDVEGIFNGKIAVTGYPRIDSTLKLSQIQRTALRLQLGIAPRKKVVLYAPTWRGTLGDRQLDNDRLLQDITLMATSGDSHFLFRGHPVTESQLNRAGISNHLVPSDVDTNDLLAIVDVLITDYSSIAFDFMATGQPIIYYAYDLEKYQEDRGLCLDISTLPGVVCKEAKFLRGAIQGAVAAAGSKGSSYDQAAMKYVSLECGESSARAVEFFFFNAPEWEMPKSSEKKKNILMFQGSFIPNGITSSYLNLVSHLNSSQVGVFLTLEPSAVSVDERRLEKFGQNPDYVKVLPRVGGQLIGAEERWVVDKFNAQGQLATREQWDIYRKAFAREFRRMFGAAQFDAVVCFEGYARFWAALFANASAENVSKSIFLHNDMHSEWQHRFRYLESMFRLYREYDSLISVTESVSEENKARLAAQFDLDPTKFKYSNNLVNAEETVALAKEPVPEGIEKWIGDAATVFVTAGRLSPEKDHAKLLNGFAMIAEQNDGVKLIILGDGPLRSQLEHQIEQLGLCERVLLTGLQLNPFPIIRRADCFVFSSNYEGQGLAVLEALILQTPVISTDVVGPRSILEGGFGLLVENSVDGLEQGMSKFLHSWPTYKPFNYSSYEQEALRTFTGIALESRSSLLIDID